MDIKIIAPAFATVQFETTCDTPALTGSEKQIAWAEKIRAKRTEELNTLVSDTIHGMVKTKMIFSDDAARIAAAEAAIAKFLDLAGAAINRVMTETSAAAWIDQRDTPTRKVFGAPGQ
ncbi:MAG: hypothetical protein Q4G24_10525 [Paracoccus sp. (in: a-proteobacteria)]|uniref:hypothetical protein n=1 Tax=Paracoccus sp. TaxID=267 RepID=UPI0026DED585|nr:hypothetical protein [Paracoccus sp. (in: a-proteobacteria)]MDO5621892.1 hypothetical protein [Paracoccus sp. (in: a-proteobacteria)]